MERFKRLIGIGVPGGLDDLVVRAVKAAINTFIGLAGLDVAGYFKDVTSVRAAAIAGASAFGSVLVNAVAVWANGGFAGQKTGDPEEVDEDA